MPKKCKQCGKDYDSDSLFCSEICHDAFDLDIKERLEDALRNDKSHTEEMST
jgi:predicted nucleic acid-binding Zn ribbon protein